MRTICFYFQVHQPFRLRRYRFFDIGNSHNYYDEFANRMIMRKVTEKCYLPANQLMYDLIKEYGSKFRISFSISGTALDQFELYAPDALDSFRKLVSTGCVELLAETYSHSLASLRNRDEFVSQVEMHSNRVEKLFGIKPVTFRNTELIYSDGIGEIAAGMGFNAILTEGAKHILGWKSPNYLYCNALNPKIKVLLKNFRLSDDIAFRFSNHKWNEWPLTTEKYTGWLNAIDKKQEIVNLFMDYETFGEHQWKETGIFEFMKHLPDRIFTETDFGFMTPSEIAANFDPVSVIHVPYPISWADEERDLTAWLGNELQDDAFDNLYSLSEKVLAAGDPDILRDWRYLQTSDHFYYQCTKWFSDGDVHKYFNPYETPYDAFINYMNILSDLELRLRQVTPVKSEPVFIRKKEAYIFKPSTIIQPGSELLMPEMAYPPLKATRRQAIKKTTASKKKRLTVKKVVKKAKKSGEKAVKAKVAKTSARVKSTGKTVKKNKKE